MHILCHRQVLLQVSLKANTGASHCCQSDDLPQSGWETVPIKYYVLLPSQALERSIELADKAVKDTYEWAGRFLQRNVLTI